MIVKLTCHITWVVLLEMKSLRGPIWSSAVALASLVRGCIISRMNTGDWGNLFPVQSNSECIKVPSLMRGLPSLCISRKMNVFGNCVQGRIKKSHLFRSQWCETKGVLGEGSSHGSPELGYLIFSHQHSYSSFNLLGRLSDAALRCFAYVGHPPIVPFAPMLSSSAVLQRHGISY